jgi:glycerol dehydrogenase-like iron-containing ADH family enzyme
MSSMPHVPAVEFTSVDNIRDERRVALLTNSAAWSALAGALDLHVRWQAEPRDATKISLLALASDIPDDVEVIYAVGGGLPFDSAKFVGRRRALPVLGIPTALSTDAPFTAVSGLRRDGGVVYVEACAPGVLYVDWDVISAAPQNVRGTGMSELLTSVVALHDWQLAESRGRYGPNERFTPFAATVMGALVEECLGLARSIGDGEVEALRRLLEMLLLEVQLCNVLGHSRAQEGSEHCFAYAVENRVGHGLPHADLIGPGIVAMAAAHGEDPAPLREALFVAGVRLNEIPPDDVLYTLQTLGDYAPSHALPYGIAHELTATTIDAAMRALLV